jgi:OmpA-OmpF porin, OOP family
VYKWRNWVGAFGAVVLLMTVSSCASSTPEQTQPTAAAPAPSPAPPPPVKEKLVLRGVHFDLNQTIVRPGDAAVLDEAITTVKANPDAVINVNGYCDALGDEEYNLKLSRYRGNAVANYLLSGGILATQLRVYGYGKTDFVATNSTAEGRAQNRRVELVPE